MSNPRRRGDQPSPDAYDDVADAIARQPPPPKPRRDLPRIGGRGGSLPKGEKYAGNAPICALTDELFDAIVGHVRAGNFRTVAAQAEGVSLPTFHKWIQRGRQQIQESMEGQRDPEQLPIQAQLVMELERVEGQCFVAEHRKVMDENGDARDRALRFAWLRARYARIWSQPSEVVDDQNATTERVDVRELLLARIEAIKAAYP